MTEETEGTEAITEPEGAAPVPPEQEQRIVDKVVDKVRDLVGTLTGGAGDGAGEEDAGEAEPIETTPVSSPRQVEADTEDQVRAALEKLRGEEEHKREHEKIRELERQPTVVSRVTRAIWGEP